MAWTRAPIQGIFLIGKTMSKPPRLVRVRSPADIGSVTREIRREGATDQKTAAGLAGVGVRFLGDLERGRPNLRLGLVLRVLDRFGLEVWVAPRGWRPTE